MRYFIWLLILCGAGGSLSAQKYVYSIKADSVKITNCDSAELIIENHTQGVPGFLYNTGNGRTIFKRGLIKINDSLYILGGDTLNINQGRIPLKWYKESLTPSGLNNYTVTGDYGVAIAGQSNTVYGINSVAAGGTGTIVGGNNSFGIGDNSVVAGGFQNLDSCVDCVIVGGDDNILHPSAVNSVILGTGRSSIYPFNSTIASASYSTINGPSGNNGIGETIIGGTGDTVRGDDGQVLGGIACNSYSFGELVTGLYSTAYTPGSSTGIVPTDRLFNIGNGTSQSARSDAFTVLKNGNTTINGGAFVTGKSFLGGTTTPTALLHLGAGTTAAGAAPLKFTSGPLLTTPEPGSMEFLTDKAYLGITTGAARKEFTLWDATGNLSSIPYVGTNGRLASSTKLTYNDYFTMTLGLNDTQYETHATFNGVPQYDAYYGMQLWNTGAATSTLPAMSPGINFRGQAWSTSSGQSQSVEFGQWIDTKNGAQAAGNWCLQSRINWAPQPTSFYNKVFAVHSGGGAVVYDNDAGITAPTLLFTDQLDNEEARMDLRSGNVCIGGTIGPASIYNTTGNIVLGQYVGNNITTGNYNIIIGNFVTAPSATANQQLDIGNLIYGTNIYNGSPYGSSSNPAPNGKIGIAVVTPTARLHLPAGTSAGGTAPLKLTAGTVLSTPENGAVEYDGTDYYVTQSTTRYKLSKTLTGQLATDFGGPSVSGFNSVTTTVSIPGVAPGDVVSVNANSGAVNPPAIIITAYVTTAGTVTLQAYNASNGSITLASDTYNIRVLK